MKETKDTLNFFKKKFDMMKWIWKNSRKSLSFTGQTIFCELRRFAGKCNLKCGREILQSNDK